MNNASNSSKFEEGLGNIKALRDLSEIFPLGNTAGIRLNPCTNGNSWIKTQTFGNNIKLRIPKVTGGLGWGDEQLLKEQQEQYEPTNTYLETHVEGVKKLGLNIVTSRGVLKSLMVLPHKKHTIVFRRNINNVLFLRNIFRKDGTDTVDMSTGTTFEEFLSEDPSKTSQPIKRFYGVFHATLGSSSIAYHAEIDALNSNNNGTCDPSVPLSLKDFTEVKTVSSETFYGRGNSSNYFYRQRLAEWWAQCELAGIREVICGILDEKYRPYTFQSNFIELTKILHLKVSQFSAKNRELAGTENMVWSERSLTDQLKFVLNRLRERAGESDIKVDTDYIITVNRLMDATTRKMKIQLGDTREYY